MTPSHNPNDSPPFLVFHSSLLHAQAQAQFSIVKRLLLTVLGLGPPTLPLLIAPIPSIRPKLPPPASNISQLWLHQIAAPFLSLRFHLLTPSPSDPHVADPSLQGHFSRALGPDVKGTMPSSVAYSETRALASDHAHTLNGSYRLGPEHKASNMDEGQPKNEDIFLNIARTDSGRRDSLGRSDFRRVSLLLFPGRCAVLS